MHEGYKDVVVHVSLLQVVCDGVLIDLGQQHHVVHTAHLDILGLPVVPLLTALRRTHQGHSVSQSLRLGSP